MEKQRSAALFIIVMASAIARESLPGLKKCNFDKRLSEVIIIIIIIIIIIVIVIVIVVVVVVVVVIIIIII